ncbi:MAG: cation-translocating P-type ATPase [Clostridia bacterium]|nr:cation-translocating P-type ATPase [Clostridia bacterium]
MKEYLSSRDQVLEQVKSTNVGLTSTEAAARLETHGKNKLAEGKKESLIVRFLKQLTDPMTIILIVAAAISGALSIYHMSKGESGEIADVIIILAVVLINAILGVVQESKAEQAIAALQQIAAATSKVLRDGKQITVPSEDLVPGDIVILEAGDAVPADCRILECASMKIEEAALTGESVPVTKTADTLSLGDKKDIPLGDRKNMVYMGSTVVYGRGTAVVVSTGMDTEMGKIADALTKAEEGKTPLQQKLSQLSKILTYLVIGICLVIFAVGFIKDGSFSFEGALASFMVAVSLAVAAIPEGLATVVTIVLSIGVTNMSKRNAVIRKLTAVETLGCAQIICSDKTGTLTQNKMTVVDYRSSDETMLATAMALCSDAELGEDGDAIGEPTECALVNYAAKLGMPKPELKQANPRIGEAPFDSMRKMMTTVHKTENGIIQYTKGAPDVVLDRCTAVYVDGKIVPMTDAIKQSILDANKEMADKALRVLCAAMRAHAEEPASYEPEDLEKNLCYVGLTGMIDPVRPEVKAAIERCNDAGIRPVMITGDHIDTAVAIALELGIITDKSQAITGAQLDEISDEQLATDITKYSVYARVQPEHKVRIVKAWKAQDKITAMTGDGVNDAPSIKNADIGVGMGITGTDVTKNVADMVLTDDNFATIISAVEEGRRIYDNIRKSVQFLLSSNLSEVVSIFVATLMGFTILKPVHLLWINLITDCLPALALGMEKAEPGIMKRKPRDSKDGIFAQGLLWDVVFQGIVVGIITLAAYFIGDHFGGAEHGITMAFLALSMTEIFHSFNMRSRDGSIFKLKTHNVVLWGAFIGSFILTALVTEVGFIADLFGFTPVGLKEYGIALALAISIIPIVEIEKLIENLWRKHKENK